MDPDELRRLYHGEGMTLKEIGDRHGMTKPGVLYHMEKHGIETRSNQRVEAPTATFTMTGRGYEEWQSSHNGDIDHVKVHRLLAVAEFGFDAVADNHVHHETNIAWDNRPENISILSPSEHNQISASNAYTRRERDSEGKFV
jgi:hypothetical protein